MEIRRFEKSTVELSYPHCSGGGIRIYRRVYFGAYRIDRHKLSLARDVRIDSVCNETRRKHDEGTSELHQPGAAAVAGYNHDRHWPEPAAGAAVRNPIGPFRSAQQRDGGICELIEYPASRSR